MLARKIGEVVDIDQADTASLPKWFVTPRVLVKVLVSKPLCPGLLINRDNNSISWVCWDLTVCPKGNLSSILYQDT